VSQPPVESFGAMLRRLRTEKGLSWQKLVRRTGNRVARTTVIQIENGQTQRPRLDTVVILAEALDLSEAERDAFIAAARPPETPGDAGTDGTAEALPPRMLPYDIETFIGRAAELQLLAEGAQRVARAGRTGVFAIEGLGGIGKTALAVHAAHMITVDFPDLFPDAHLFLDLHGYTPDVSALAPKDALRSLLQQLGVPHALVPARQSDRETMFRSSLASRKSLVILDNARDADQVRPLLPGSACCMVIVTSRDALRSLDGATVLQLGTPPDAEAIALFRKVAGLDPADGEDLALPADPRLAEIVALCAGLPLAVQVVAARLSRRAALGVSGILTGLAEEHDRLSLLQDRHRGVRAAFQSSLRHLDPGEKELFTRLALVPSTDFDVCAAASLSGAGPDLTMDRLESLLDQHLLILRAPDRFEFHDLARLYARELADHSAEQAANDAATDRLLEFYLATARRADRLFERGLPFPGEPADEATGEPGDEATALPRLATSQDAQRWFTTELHNLKASAELAVSTGRTRIAIGLPAALSDYLRTHGPWSWALSLHQSALDEATRSGDRPGQAGALRSVGGVLSRTGRIAESKEKFGQALEVYRELGDERGVGRALIELSIAQRVTDEPVASLASLTEALSIFQRMNDRQGEAAALTELSSLRWQTGDIAEAERNATTGLHLYQDLGNRQGQAAALLYLGPIQQVLGALGAAEDSLRQAGEIGLRLGQPILRANSLLHLSEVQREAGRLAPAKDSLDAARALYEQLSYQQGIAKSLTYLARVAFLMGEPAAADAHIAEALALLGEINDPSDTAEALNIRGAIARADGRGSQARDDHHRALDLAIKAGFEREQGAAHLGLAVLDAGSGSAAHSGNAADAIAHCQAALALYESAGYKAGVARAGEVLSEISGPGEAKL
jgi:tetratricopeptide (TPR) repeat protein/transcriptional regulator with XRE-family HTH domain